MKIGRTVSSSGQISRDHITDEFFNVSIERRLKMRFTIVTNS